MSRYARQLQAQARQHESECDCCDHGPREPAPYVEPQQPDPHGRWADFAAPGPRDVFGTDGPVAIEAARKHHSADYDRAVRLYGQANVDEFGV